MEDDTWRFAKVDNKIHELRKNIQTLYVVLSNMQTFYVKKQWTWSWKSVRRDFR